MFNFNFASHKIKKFKADYKKALSEEDIGGYNTRDRTYYVGKQRI